VRRIQRVMAALVVMVWLGAAAPTGFAGDRESAIEQRNLTTLVRQLTNRSEPIRHQAMTRVSGTSRDLLAYRQALITAVHGHAQETAADDFARPSTVRLIYLIGQIDHADCESTLIDLLDDDHAGIAMIAADALGQNKRYGAIEFLKRQIDREAFDNDYGFRFNLVRALAQMHHPDAVEFLTTLHDSLDGQLHFEITQILDAVDESDFLGDAERFDRWLSTRKPKLVLQAASFESGSMSNPRMRFGQRQKYYGIDINAKRILFVIDRSGSMEDYDRGMTRLERAKLELTRAITDLPPDAEFGITFFETTVRQWRQKLVVADEQNKREAIAFVQRLGYGDRTNTYGALLATMEFDDQLEAVFLLSDGRPTLGKIMQPAAIVADIMHRNRFRHLHFNTIGIAVNQATETFLKALAEESGGEYRRAD
jgi:hypothetical protein